MKRTISIKLLTSQDQGRKLENLQKTFAEACNAIVPQAVGNKCSNRFKLHHMCYYDIREKLPMLGSQMVCNAIHKVSTAYKTLLSNRPKFKKEDWPAISYSSRSSIHFDKRTFTLRDNAVSLFTMEKRIRAEMKLGNFQKAYLEKGTPKEAELIKKPKGWFLNLVLEVPDAEPGKTGGVLGVDLGESNLATTSSGKLFDGGKLSHERDKFLNLRKRLQRNGSKSAKQLLQKVSGRESRHVRHVNHEVSRKIVAEAVRTGCSTIAMENLTNIRKRIKAGKRVRSRLHRWAWRELQDFVEYKAKEAGIQVVYVNPAYTSKTCSVCGNTGVRQKHRFSCPVCGRLAHADLNAGLNIASLGLTAVRSTGAVNHRHVEAF